jgi:Tfp pilus assembly protein PilF
VLHTIFALILAPPIQVLELAPDHVNAAYARAACYNSKGQFSRAIEDYNLALTKDQVRSRH